MQPGGQLAISAYVEEDSIVLAVANEGSGIPPEIRDKLGRDSSDQGTTFYVRFKKQN